MQNNRRLLISFIIFLVPLIFCTIAGAKTYMLSCKESAFYVHDMQGWDFKSKSCGRPLGYYSVNGFNAKTSPAVIYFTIIPKNGNTLEQIVDDNISALKEDNRDLIVEDLVLIHVYKNISKTCIFGKKKIYVSFLDPGENFGFCIYACMSGKKNVTPKYEKDFYFAVQHCRNAMQR